MAKGHTPARSRQQAKKKDKHARLLNIRLPRAVVGCTRVPSQRTPRIEEEEERTEKRNARSTYENNNSDSEQPFPLELTRDQAATSESLERLHDPTIAAAGSTRPRTQHEHNKGGDVLCATSLRQGLFNCNPWAPPAVIRLFVRYN